MPNCKKCNWYNDELNWCCYNHAEELVQKPVMSGTDHEALCCPCCGTEVAWSDNYCRECGARLR